MSNLLKVIKVHIETLKYCQIRSNDIDICKVHSNHSQDGRIIQSYVFQRIKGHGSRDKLATTVDFCTLRRNVYFILKGEGYTYHSKG